MVEKLSIGELRRFECSLTKDERRSLEIDILISARNGTSDFDPKYGAIIESLVKRGLLNQFGTIYKTTSRGESALGHKNKE